MKLYYIEYTLDNHKFYSYQYEYAASLAQQKVQQENLKYGYVWITYIERMLPEW